MNMADWLTKQGILSLPEYAKAVSNLTAKGITIAEEIILCILQHIIIKDEVVLQSLIGLLNTKFILVEDDLVNAELLGNIIVACGEADLFDIEQRKTWFVCKNHFIFDEDIPTYVKHETLLQPVKPSNKILGGRLKQSNSYKNIQHLARMDNIPLRLSARVVSAVRETPKKAIEDPESREHWDNFVDLSMAEYKELLAMDSTFYNEWNFDARGRSYSAGYLVNPQGNQFKKAIIELAHKELINKQ